MKNFRSKRTLMDTITFLDKDENSKSVDQKVYRGIIGSLLYITASKPDIMFSIYLCARYQSNPKESYLKAVKIILRYIHNTVNYDLFYPKSSTFDLMSYNDADFAECKSYRKNISDTCHFLGHSLIPWFSKKQNSVSLSINDAEYIAASVACAQIL